MADVDATTTPGSFSDMGTIHWEVKRTNPLFDSQARYRAVTEFREWPLAGRVGVQAPVSSNA